MNIKSYLTPTKKYKSLVSCTHSVYRLLNSTFELKDLINRLTKLLCQMFNSRICSILMLDGTKKYSLLKCIVCEKKKYVIDKKIKVTNRLEKRIIKTLASVRSSHLLAIPLICDDLIGIIILKRNKDDASFDRFDQELLMTLAEQAIIGIKNLRLYEEQQKIVIGSIKSLVTLLDTRVPQEYTHSPYFSKLVTDIAIQMHLDEKQIESLRFASLLHDAGKVDIPLEILTKTTKLTAEEYKIIKRHPAKGAQILRPLQILKPVVPIIMYHHEKYNGTGYPSRLKKGQIPQGARIMAVADAFEAMVYGRPYRERMNINSAIKEIRKKNGSQFDPEVVDAFLKVVKRLNKKIYLKQNFKKR